MGESEKTFTYRGSETGHHIGVIVYAAMKMRYKCHNPSQTLSKFEDVIRFDPGSCTVGAD